MSARLIAEDVADNAAIHIAPPYHRTFWEERYGRTLSDAEIQEIVQNSINLVNLLTSWRI